MHDVWRTIEPRRVQTNRYRLASRLLEVVTELRMRHPSAVVKPRALPCNGDDHLGHQILGSIWNSTKAGLNEAVIDDTPNGK